MVDCTESWPLLCGWETGDIKTSSILLEKICEWAEGFCDVEETWVPKPGLDCCFPSCCAESSCTSGGCIARSEWDVSFRSRGSACSSEIWDERLCDGTFKFWSGIWAAKFGRNLLCERTWFKQTGLGTLPGVRHEARGNTRFFLFTLLTFDLYRTIVWGFVCVFEAGGVIAIGFGSDSRPTCTENGDGRTWRVIKRRTWRLKEQNYHLVSAGLHRVYQTERSSDCAHNFWWVVLACEPRIKTDHYDCRMLRDDLEYMAHYWEVSGKG